MVPACSLLVGSIVAVVCTTVTVNGLSSSEAGLQETNTEWASRENGCSSTYLCCQGKNNTCRVDGPRVSNSDSFTCFCDSACFELGDCCVDYKSTCRRQSPAVWSIVKLTTALSESVLSGAVERLMFFALLTALIF